jgi:peroxiredoxin Q/BCP
MPPVLRKRKAPEQPPAPAPAAKRATKPKAAPKAKAAATKTKAAAAPKAKAPAKKAAAAAPEKKENGAPPPAAAPAVGDVIDLEGFGGEVETHDGEKVTLKGLVDESKGGVVLFTYPKASTPGCK